MKTILKLLLGIISSFGLDSGIIILARSEHDNLAGLLAVGSTVEEFTKFWRINKNNEKNLSYNYKILFWELSHL